MQQTTNDGIKTTTVKGALIPGGSTPKKGAVRQDQGGVVVSTTPRPRKEPKGVAKVAPQQTKSVTKKLTNDGVTVKTIKNALAPALSTQKATSKVKLSGGANSTALERPRKPPKGVEVVVPESEQSLVRTSIVNGYSQNKFNGGVIPVGFTPVIKRYDDEKRPVSGGGGVTALGFEDSVWREHIDDLDNPHRVTAAQVGNTEAVWNANKLQGYDIAMDAPANGQFLQWHSDTQEWTASSIPTFISEDTDTDLVGYVQGDGSNVFATTTIPNTDITGLGTASTKNTAFFLQSANNLNDVASASASRNNLGLGTAAVKDTTFFLQAANNLNDLGSSTAARNNLGLGGAAIKDVTFFLQAANNLNDLGSASAARNNLGLGDLATMDAADFLQPANNLSELTNTTTARSNLGLGSIATQNVGSFLQAANNLSELINPVTARSNLGLGTTAIKDTGTSGNTVPLLDGANSWSAAQTFVNSSGVKILDTNASHTLGLVVGSDLTATRTLTITTGDASRVLTLSGDATISGTNTGDQTITLTGNVTGSGTGSFATTIAAGVVTNSMLAGSIAASKLVGTDIATVGTITSGTWTGTAIALGYGGTGAALADPNADRILFWDDSAGQVTWLTAGSGLNITGTTLTASGAALSDGDYGDITVSSSGTVWTIDPGVVTFAKMQAVSANILLGNDATGTTVEEITCTAAGRAILDDATAGDQRTTLGLGTAAVQNTGTSGTNVPLLDGANSWSAAQTFVNSSGVKILDTNASHTLGLVVGSNLTADHTLTITTGDADRVLTLSGDATISGTSSGTNTGDQTITLTGNVTGSGTGSFATTIAAGVVTNSMLAGSIAASKLIGTDIATVGTITSGTWNGTAIGLAYGGTGASLADPNADRILFWDDSAGQVTWLTAGTGLSISGTTLTASGTTVADADYGDITVSSSGTVWTIHNVNAAKVTGTINNIIINGNFNIWQRGTSFTGITGAITYAADRWAVICSGAAVLSATQENTVVPTVAQSGNYSLYSYKLAVTTADASITANDYTAIRYIIEGYDFQAITQQQFTLSFWVRAFKTGTYCVGFVNSGNDRSYVAEYSISVSNTWEYKTVTISASPVLTDGVWQITNGVGLRVYFTIAGGSTYQTTAGSWTTGNFFSTSNQVNGTDSTSNTFYLSQVAITLGATGARYTPVAFDYEMHRCFRYYMTYSGQAIGVAQNGDNMYGRGVISFPSEMRTTPSLEAGASYSVNAGSAGTVSLTGTSTKGTGFGNSANNWTTNALVSVTANLTAEY